MRRDVKRLSHPEKARGQHNVALALDFVITSYSIHYTKLYDVSNRALLVTEGNLFLEQVYSVLPGVEAFKTTPGSDLLAENGEAAFDLYVFDGVSLPQPLPPADMLVINPQVGDGGDLFTVRNNFV